MLYETPVFRPMGDRALLVELGDEVSPPGNRKVRELLVALERHAVEGILEIVPSYRSITVVFDPLRVAPPELGQEIAEAYKRMDSTEIPPPRTLEVPVVYGGNYGPDLEFVARYHRLTPDEVITLHTGTAYHVYMIGFLPGFPYMGDLPDALNTPRRETPRVAVPRDPWPSPSSRRASIRFRVLGGGISWDARRSGSSKPVAGRLYPWKWVMR